MLFHFYISINQLINYFLPLWLLRCWRSTNPYITEGSQVGMSIFVACRIGQQDTRFFFVCGYWSVFYLLTYLLTSFLCNCTIIIPTENNFVAHFVMCTVDLNCGSSVNSNLREYCIVLFYKWNASVPVYYLHLTWRSSFRFYWHAEGGAKYSGDVTAQARIPFDEDS